MHLIKFRSSNQKKRQVIALSQTKIKFNNQKYNKIKMLKMKLKIRRKPKWKQKIAKSIVNQITLKEENRLKLI